MCKQFVIDVTDHSRVRSTSSNISVLFWWWKSIRGFLEIIWVQMKIKMQCWLVSCPWFRYTMPKKQTVALWHNRFLPLIGLIKPPSVIYIWQRGHCHVFSWPASLSACRPVGPLKRRPLRPSACRSLLCPHCASAVCGFTLLSPALPLSVSVSLQPQVHVTP